MIWAKAVPNFIFDIAFVAKNTNMIYDLLMQSQ